MTVRQLLDSLDSRELSEWIAFHTHIEPIGETRADLRTGIVASTLANVNRGKNQQPYKAIDFMPYLDKPPQSQGQMKSAFFAAFEEKQ
jgi:alpha-D-ribose 1-methylphosphonate 5-triphosphate synthase subunit PhnH